MIYIDGKPAVCEDCGKVIESEVDRLSFFDNFRCEKCEAVMFAYMESENEKV